MTISRINGVNKYTNDYDAFLVDAWGVLHDGIELFEKAGDCLKQLRAANKKVIILSNAARRSSVLGNEMSRLGLTSMHYDHIVSSGEAAWQALNNRSEPGQLDWGKKCLFVGPTRSRSLLEGLSLTEVFSVEAASFLLVTGVENMSDSVEKYEQLLQQAYHRNLPLVCANSDRLAIRGGTPYFCGGALAIRYAELGGRVFEFGKPKRPIYDRCLSLLPEVPVSRILAIGDSFETDIPGAANAGIDSLFVTQGIHAELFLKGSNSDTVVKGLIDSFQCSPKFMIDELQW